MRTCCRFFALVLLSLLVTSAKAGKINILDPNYPATGITDVPFTIGGPNNSGFVTCASSGELPKGVTADGCYAGINSTGKDWTSVELVVPDTGPVVGQTFACNTDGTAEFFASTSCTFNATTNSFDLIFTDGVIPTNTAFVITEDGVLPPGDFPATTAIVGFAATPEPPAAWLLLTGMVCFGLYRYSRRQAEA